MTTKNSAKKKQYESLNNLTSMEVLEGERDAHMQVYYYIENHLKRHSNQYVVNAASAISQEMKQKADAIRNQMDQ